MTGALKPCGNKVAVIDYGMGNLHSVASALRQVGSDDVQISSDPAVIRAAERVIFPGVGAIRDCMAEIRRLQFDRLVPELIASGKPLLAICVGMQALMQHSEENGGVECIGVLPGHASIGLAAPVLLVLLRIAQGIGVGGEWGGSVLLSMEWGDERRRGLMASWPQLGVPLGLLASTGMVKMTNAMSGGGFDSWGWRIPFLASVVLIGVGLYVRLRVLESPAFTEVKKERVVVRQPVWSVLRHQPRFHAAFRAEPGDRHAARLQFGGYREAREDVAARAAGEDQHRAVAFAVRVPEHAHVRLRNAWATAGTATGAPSTGSIGRTPAACETAIAIGMIMFAEAVFDAASEMTIAARVKIAVNDSVECAGSQLVMASPNTVARPVENASSPTASPPP